MIRTRLLLVQPDPHALAMLASMLRSSGHELVEATTDRQALRLLRDQQGLVLQGVDPAGSEALELLAYTRRKFPQTPVVLLFTTPGPERASEALRMGAAAVLQFPLPASRLRAAVVQALDAGASPPPTQEDQPVVQEDEIDIAGPIGGMCRTQPVGRSVGEAVSGRGIVQAGKPLRPLKEALEGPEREFILRALEAYRGNRTETAKALDINRTTLYKKMKKYGLLDEEDA